jgi:hypothetical protein
MRIKPLVVTILILIVMVCAFGSIYAQQIQLPTLQVCNRTEVVGAARVEIYNRGLPAASPFGEFKIKIEARCNPPGYPEGSLKMSVNLSDGFTGSVESSTFYQLTSMGKHGTTAFLSGPCDVSGSKGCRFWLMVADNKRSPDDKTPDIISFLIIDGAGKRLAHGTGPAVEGDIKVVPAAN